MRFPIGFPDHLVRLESFVREAFPQRQHAVGVFFDLDKAYESMWKFGIMRDLHNAGLCGRLLLFIESFLKNRQFHVRLRCSYSDLFDQEMGGTGNPLHTLANNEFV